MRLIKCNNCGKTFPPKWGTLELETHASTHYFKGFTKIE